MIKIQKEDFNLENEIAFIKSQHSDIGAVSTFVGYVRNINDKKNVTSIDLEDYPEMAERSLSKICNQAKKKMATYRYFGNSSVWIAQCKSENSFSGNVCHPST